VHFGFSCMVSGIGLRDSLWTASRPSFFTLVTCEPSKSLGG
jgi:hypothetical protein